MKSYAALVIRYWVWKLSIFFIHRFSRQSNYICNKNTLTHDLDSRFHLDSLVHCRQTSWCDTHVNCYGVLHAQTAKLINWWFSMKLTIAISSVIMSILLKVTLQLLICRAISCKWCGFSWVFIRFKCEIETFGYLLSFLKTCNAPQYAEWDLFVVESGMCFAQI